MLAMMTIAGAWLWGLLATGLLTSLLRAGQTFHFTRLDLPLLLGTLLTPNRDRAKVIGFVIHFVNGWLFAFLYAAFFHQFGFATWWLGGLMGLAHAAFVLMVVLPLLPGLHAENGVGFSGSGTDDVLGTARVFGSQLRQANSHRHGHGSSCVRGSPRRPVSS